ncbi:MAG TPA: hypothetical protein ENN39_06370 [Desulfonatronum sp.]|nr:hypothetical protein [Desulfonatronum sp.]
MDNDLIKLLRKNKAMLIEKWVLMTLQTYPDQSARFFIKEKNPFANPVGNTLEHSLTELFDALVDGQDIKTIVPILDGMAHIRAVQGFSPSRSLSFLLFLKEIIRQELNEDVRRLNLHEQAVDFGARIDGVLLLAFDAFMKCREKLYQIRVNEMLRQHSGLLKRAGLECVYPQEKDGGHRGVNLEESN